MKEFGAEYLRNYADFIADGRTLEIIKKYEDDKKNSKVLLAKVADDYGAKEVFGTSCASFTLDHKTNDPALVFDKEYGGKDGKPKIYSYNVNQKTPEGKALQARLDDIPDFEWTFRIFAKRLTGAENVPTNPDNLYNESGYGIDDHYKPENTLQAATYSKYGDQYVVEVPRTVHGIFNAASQKKPKKDEPKTAIGYNYEWFTPPDSHPIPDSKVSELREKELGDQTKPRKVMEKIFSIKPRQP